MCRVGMCYKECIVVMDMIGHRLFKYEKLRFICSELGKSGKCLFGAANLCCRCAQYFVIVSCG